LPYSFKFSQICLDLNFSRIFQIPHPKFHSNLTVLWLRFRKFNEAKGSNLHALLKIFKTVLYAALFLGLYLLADKYGLFAKFIN